MAISCVVPWNVAQFLDRSWLIPTYLVLSLDQLHHLDMAELYWTQVENCGGVLQLLLSRDSFSCSFHHPIGFSSLTVVPGGHFLPKTPLLNMKAYVPCHCVTAELSSSTGPCQRCPALLFRGHTWVKGVLCFSLCHWALQIHLRIKEMFP